MGMRLITNMLSSFCMFNVLTIIINYIIYVNHLRHVLLVKMYNKFII